MSDAFSVSRDDSWAKRLDGLLPAGIGNKRVAIIGCGSVGSFIADELARSGIRNFLLIDPDIVEWPNLTRAAFGYQDIGKAKVVALTEHLSRIFPDLAIVSQQVSIQQIRNQLRAMLSGVDIVIAAVDDPAANGVINRQCYALGIPSTFVGIYKGAKGGEIIFVNPSFTPCFHCATGGLREALPDTEGVRAVQPNRDYQTNRLVGEIALGADIHLVCCAATKIALSMLSDGQDNASLAGFARAKLMDGGNYLMIGMEPSYFIFPETHENAIGQYAYQTIWAKATRRPTCSVCGDPDQREPPI